MSKEESDFFHVSMYLLSSIIENAIIIPNFPKYKEAVDLADKEVSKIIEEDKNPESLMMAFQREIKNYLKR